jgi:hypothetical protein
MSLWTPALNDCHCRFIDCDRLFPFNNLRFGRWHFIASENRVFGFIKLSSDKFPSIFTNDVKSAECSRVYVIQLFTPNQIITKIDRMTAERQKPKKKKLQIKSLQLDLMLTNQLKVIIKFPAPTLEFLLKHHVGKWRIICNQLSFYATI